MADPITWYALGRTVGDTESIMEEMDAKILTHNLDPSAHGQTGEVVFEHRNATLLDHLFGSVDMKHLVANKSMLFTCFESTSGWTVVGTFSAYVFEAELITTNVPNNVSRAHLVSSVSASAFNLSKNPFFQTTFNVPSEDYQLIYVAAGDMTGGDSGDAFGFKISENSLYAFVRIGASKYTTQITGITLQGYNVFRAYFDYTDQKTYFYVNGVLKHTESSHVPSSNSAYYFTYYVKTTIDMTRDILISDLLFEQDR